MAYQTSIIITCHNNFDITTGPCLRSLRKDNDCNKFEIVIVDNASQDGSSEKLRETVSNEKNVKLRLNRVDRGYAGANNDGANIAEGDVLVLLSSDTVVPPGSIGKLSELLTKNASWALLGPVTNEAGNEQKIFVQSTQVEKILEEGARWCSHSKNDFFNSVRLDFFCVAMLKKTYEKLGGLDERFGLGYYEDTDFSIRANQMGLNMMFTEDVFVYHKGGGTFSKMGKGFVKRLMRKNKKKLEKKHSRKIKLYHMRNRNMHVLNEYVMLKRYKADVLDRDLDYKFHNRLVLAKSMYPNNPLKKLIYHSHLKSLCRRYYR